ncbi:hypothetical protein MUK42_35599 [Musa troglodytarum]|uniref:Uncharacterized protein n=1 Tax=Musa troglodytarum TaxID=320322 RepID=A0A9E7K477_9LILI|nr:hypothetical protein MUK42_35599 [Musa troglodytarum]
MDPSIADGNTNHERNRDLSTILMSLLVWGNELLQDGRIAISYRMRTVRQEYTQLLSNSGGTRLGWDMETGSITRC